MMALEPTDEQLDTMLRAIPDGTEMGSRADQRKAMRKIWRAVAPLILEEAAKDREAEKPYEHDETAIRCAVEKFRATVVAKIKGDAAIVQALGRFGRGHNTSVESVLLGLADAVEKMPLEGAT